MAKKTARTAVNRILDGVSGLIGLVLPGVSAPSVTGLMLMIVAEGVA